MNPCKTHKGTLIPESWVQQKGLGDELFNLHTTMEKSRRARKVCTECGYWVYEPAKRSLTDLAKSTPFRELFSSKKR